MRGTRGRVPVRPSLVVEPSTAEETPAQLSVLFCCLGNICRSTMAEGVFRSLVKAPLYEKSIGRVDSCGTASYHTGARPDDRTMATLRAHGITDYVHKARQITSKDFDTFDFIFAMDRSNLAELERLYGPTTGEERKAIVVLFGDKNVSGTGKQEIVDDPYYGGQRGFEVAYEQAVRFSTNFLQLLEANSFDKQACRSIFKPSTPS